MAARLLCFGSVPLGGETVAAWDDLIARAPGSDGVVVAVSAVDSGALEAWLRTAPGRPATVLLVGSASETSRWLRAGADEVTADSARLGALIDRARHRSVARHRADQFRQMVEHTRDMVSVLDGFGRYVYVSPSVREHLGYEPADLIGLNALEAIHPDDLADTMGVFLEAIGTPGSTRALSYRYRASDGSYRNVEGMGRALLGPDGEPIAVVNARDVTERTRTEAALRASEARFRSLLGALPDVISEIRRDGLVLDFHVPPVFATEFPAEALIGKKLQDEIPEDLGAKFLDAVAQVDASPGPVTYRYAVESGGESLYREARIVPHGPEEVLSILRDVTPEVRAELGLRASKAELEASQAELRALAAHLQDVREEERAHLSREVHDTLGQQLTAIRYAVGWFGRRLEQDEIAQQRLTDARALIDETIARVRRIAADLRPGVLDDFGLAMALEWYAERFAERTGLSVTVRESGDMSRLPDDIATAAFRIAQEALTNVARHADAETVQIRVEADDAELQVRIQDDGVGLDPDALQGRRSLGVVGMRERARAQGGTLQVSGAPGKGAVVSVTFPLPPPETL